MASSTIEKAGKVTTGSGVLNASYCSGDAYWVKSGNVVTVFFNIEFTAIPGAGVSFVSQLPTVKSVSGQKFFLLVGATNGAVIRVRIVNDTIQLYYGPAATTEQGYNGTLTYITE